MLSQALVLKINKKKAVLAALAVFLFSAGSMAYDGTPAPKVADEKAKELEGVGIDEKLGDKLDLSLKFRNDDGQEVPLSHFFDGKHPVIISPVYFSCPGLCNFHLNGLTDALKLMDKNWSVGKKFSVLSVSFDSKETSDLAAKKKETYMKLYDREGTAKGWHFLSGSEESVKALTQALGFKFRWDETAKEWAHASAAIIVTPDGKISRYLPGIMFNPQDIKLGLNEATEGKIGTMVDSLILYCFMYDPAQSKYTLAAFNLMKMAGAFMVMVMLLWLLPIYIRSRKAKNKAAGR